MARDEAYRRAEEMIEEARRTGATILDLSVGEDDKTTPKLTELPESLGQLAQLKELDLSDNRLTALPESLGQLRQLRSLLLLHNQLTALPKWLGQLTQLQKLGLNGNQLTALPEWLGRLTQLQWLSLTGNRLTALPKSLGQLTRLQALDLASNQLTVLPESLGKLRELGDLALVDNQLTALPDSLGQLTKLRSLWLSGNQLTALPESLGQLAKLTGLDLSGNRLTALPECLGELTRLRTLLFSNSQLTALPESLGQLTELEVLDLSANQLTTLPESLGQLRRLGRLDLSRNQLTSLPDSLRGSRNLLALYLHENPGLGLPPSMLGPTWDAVDTGDRPASPRAILAFYFGRGKRGAKPLNEVKLLLVGHGRVGKTSLSKALRGVPHDATEPETPGIERHPLLLSAGRSKITAHIWDFGGQEFLHQTHQFFFSENSIYVVVLSGREGARPMQEAEYWLRLIRTYGAGSPVVIALNKIEAHPFTVDEHFLQENYPEVKAVVRTDCHPRQGIEPLQKLLGKLAGAMPSVREKIAPSWARVRTRLEETEKSFVSFAEYRGICVGQGVTEPEKQETLATILDWLGIALNYRNDPRLRDTSVLKPRWLVDGIYTILRSLHKRQTNGEMRIEDFPKALKDKKTYPEAMHGFLLTLMEKFELCFPVEDEDGLYLVPALLDANQPREMKEFMGPEARRIQFRYEDVRPPGLLPRFVVRSHTLSDGQPRWLRGVVLKRGTARALVRGDYDGRVTDVYALGKSSGDRVWLTEFIVQEMRALNGNLPVRTLVETEGQPGAWTELEILREAARKDESTRAERSAGGATVMVDVKQTLREVESAEASAPHDAPLPLFVCYAHANERFVRQLVPSLKVLARRGYIAPWRDTDLVAGEDWDETIKERLANAKVILFMVSRDFLASHYITTEERPLAMRLVADRKAVVLPVLLTESSWQEEDFKKFENLPHKDRLVTSYTPRENAWALVEDGIKAAVARARETLGIGGPMRSAAFLPDLE